MSDTRSLISFNVRVTKVAAVLKVCTSRAASLAFWSLSLVCYDLAVFCIVFDKADALDLLLQDLKPHAFLFDLLLKCR